MFRSLSRNRRFGFTLVEVLVTTVVVGVMAAVVIPAMVKQATAGDPPRVASDLGSVKSAIELFSQNVRPRMPGDIEDLVNTISLADVGLDGTVYTSTNLTKYKGPYLEWTAASSTTNTLTDIVFKSGGSAEVHSALYRCPTTSTAGTYSSGNATGAADHPCAIYTTTSGNVSDAYAAVKVTGIGASTTEFNNLNEVIDGTDESDPDDAGLLRQNASGTIFFLAVPYTAP